MQAENKYGIVPFAGENFDNWKFRLNTLLCSMDVKKVMKTVTDSEKTDAWHTANNKAMMLIIQNIADSHLEYVKDIDSAYKMLQKLESIFEKRGTYSKFHLLQELMNLKYDTSSDLQSHFAKCDKIFRELRSLGSAFEESDMACFVLLSMPLEYENVVTAIRTISEDQLKMDFVKSRLLEFKTSKSNDGNKMSSFVSRKEVKCFKCGKMGHTKSLCGIKCFKCKRFGHKAAECKKEVKANYAEKENRNLDEVAFSATVGDGMANYWYADSGATHHYINDRSMLQRETKYDVPKHIQLAEAGKSMEAVSIGDVEVLSKVGENIHNIIIRDVMCVPKLRVNLLSIPSIEKAGFDIICSSGKIHIKKNGITYVVGERVGNLYKIQFYEDNKKANLSCVDDTDLWHRRYGHLNYLSLSKLSQLKLVKGISDNLKFKKELCEICILSKQKCLPYKSRTNRSTRVLELVHTDVCGPLTPESNNENKYFVSFIDDFSRFAMIFIIKNKSEVFECFKEYYERVSTIFVNKRLSKLRCDNGGEYRSRDLMNFCKEKGIQLQYTPPYSPQVNGVAERFNQTVLNKARSMITQSKLSKKFWEEAVLTAAYIMNRSQSCIVENKTPYELWLGKKPNVSNMRVFGCICYARIPDSLRTKLDDKGRKCRFVGYTENGFRLWDVNKGEMLHSRNVVFDEFNFDNSEIKSTEQMNENEQQIKFNTQNNMSENESECSDNEVNDETDRNEILIEDRPKRNRKLPSKLNDYEVDVSCLALLSEFSGAPKSYKEAKSSSDWCHWKKAVREELDALIENNTWEFVDRPTKEKILSNRWVFRTKENGGHLTYKARLVVRGFEQNFSELSQIHAPVAKLSSFRMFLSIAVNYDLKLIQLDVKNAFLNGFMDEKVYMSIPEGLHVSEENKNKVCLLNKSLYGLKQAPRIWNQQFNELMTTLDFKRSKSDYCLYTYLEHQLCCYLLLYVDDILIACNDLEFLNNLQLKLNDTFKMKQITEVKNFLGINICINNEENKITIDQKSAIEYLIDKYNVQDCKKVKTPMEVNLDLKRNEDVKFITKLPYKELLGSLTYIMIGSRPDICFSIGFFGRYQECATDEHFKHLLRVLKYLKYTKNLKLSFLKSNETLTGYVDADWANDKDSRKSITGFCFKLFGNLISWSSKKQSMVTLSSTESEFVAICDASCELMHIRNLLHDLGIKYLLPFVIFEDNQSTIKLLNNFENNKRCKHIDVKLHYVLDLLNEGLFILEYICTSEQLGDIFTKSLGSTKFNCFVNKLNLLS